MNGIVAENGKVVTDEMIADWESALERDEWPSGWVNVGEVVEGKLPKAAPETVKTTEAVFRFFANGYRREHGMEPEVTGNRKLSERDILSGMRQMLYDLSNE